eukprot:3080618-Amphidinium_carterae.2
MMHELPRHHTATMHPLLAHQFQLPPASTSMRSSNMVRSVPRDALQHFVLRCSIFDLPPAVRKASDVNC